MTLHLTKHHGLGNDFLIAFAEAVPADAAALARTLCARTTGIGADGLIFGIGSRPIEFVLFNADGSQAEVSGNGLRCFGQALAMADGVDTLDISVGTAAGPRRISVLGPGSAVGELDVEVDMGMAGPGPTLEGRDPARHLDVARATTIDMGNPHLVLEVNDAAAHDMSVVGPLVEADYLADGGINVHLVSPTPGGVSMNIWERGAGVTQACGSGACAAAVAAAQWGWGEESGQDRSDVVAVQMPGGAATVTVSDTIRLRGPAAFVASLEVPRG